MPTGTLVTFVIVPSDVISADAEMYVAPAEKLLVAFKMIEAVPVPSVRAVAAGGVNVTSELSDAAKVTMDPFTRFPLASVSTAVIVTGDTYVTLDGALKTREAAAVVVLLPVPEASSLLPPQALRQQNRAKKISSNAGRENFTLINFIILISFFMRDR
jgi:hypothetical protein